VKVLNLYAGIGGNRKLWRNVEVTAIENNPEIAKIYKHFFPEDKIIVTDAHEYLLKNFENFDFIWSSPPCPSHSRIRNVAGVGSGQNKPIYPDMKLYEEIIFLNQVYHTSGTKFRGSFVVENVQSYYEPLIKPIKAGRHYFWSNFYFNNIKIKSMINKGSVEDLQKLLGFDLTEFEKVDKRVLLRNCVEPELGKHVFNSATLKRQQTIWSGF